MKNSKLSGFTMIELLVVVAIIAILSAVVTTLVTSSRNRSNDSKIQSQMASLKKTIEVYGSSNGNDYGMVLNSCIMPNTVFTDIVSDTYKFTTVANYPAGTVLSCYSSGSTWAVSASMSTNYWCVDSNGKTGKQATQITGPFCL